VLYSPPLRTVTKTYRIGTIFAFFSFNMPAVNGNSLGTPNGEKSSTYADHMLTKWLQDHKPRATAMKDQPAFYRNLEQAMDISRAEPSFHAFHVAKPRWDDSVLDFTSSDFLSFSRSGRIREAFMEELGRHEDFRLSASGSRM
jgi:hypothetical protein